MKKGGIGCANSHIYDEVFYKAFVEVFNKLVENQVHFIAKWNEQIKSDDIVQVDLFFKIVEKIMVCNNAYIESIHFILKSEEIK